MASAHKVRGSFKKEKKRGDEQLGIGKNGKPIWYVRREEATEEVFIEKTRKDGPSGGMIASQQIPPAKEKEGVSRRVSPVLVEKRADRCKKKEAKRRRWSHNKLLDQPPVRSGDEQDLCGNTRLSQQFGNGWEATLGAPDIPVAPIRGRIQVDAVRKKKKGGRIARQDSAGVVGAKRVEKKTRLKETVSYLG